MNRLVTLSYLFLFITLVSSCEEKKSPQKEIGKSKFSKTIKSDTLTFTSGVRAIFQDSKGNYWLGSHREGVSRFDGESFEYFTTNEGLPNNQIRSIQEDTNGSIWFGTGNGVASYSGDKITDYTLFADNNSSFLSKETVNTLWFNAGSKDGVYRYDGKKLSYLDFPNPEIEDPNKSYAVTGISKDLNGTVWIATFAALFHFEGNSIQLVENSKLALKEHERLHIRSVLADSKGRVWIGNNGIGVLLHQDNSTINFSDKNGLIHSGYTNGGSPSPAGTLEHVFAIAEDSKGNIWFGDKDTGAWKYDGKSMTNYPIDEKLNSPMIWDIYEDKEKNLLFAKQDGGVFQFNGTSFNKRF